MDHHRSNTQDPHVFSTSEFDSFSDSDWLDIARESDTESLSSRDSDRPEVASSPLSRRSSFSTSSSRDGEVEAWEGFVEDSADEGSPVVDPDQPPLTAEAGLLAGPSSGPVTEDNVAEDRLVRDGLDQSVISTLSASRSSSHPSTVQNSLRDLRLSFPDPLTSSRNELNRSYDTVSPTDVNVAASSEDDEPPAPLALSDSMSAQDPSLPPTPEVLAQDTTVIKHHTASKANSSFEVVLYGRPSSIKWSFVRDLLRKASLGNEYLSGDAEKALLEGNFGESDQFIDNTPILDRTCGSSPMPRSEVPPNRPSLAVVYLPCLPSLPDEHTFYLPVIPPSDNDSQTFDQAFEEAQAAWSTFCIPSDKVLRLEGCSNSSMFAAEDVDKLDPVLVRKALRQLLSPVKSSTWNTLFEQFNAAHAVTIFALLCLVAGFSLNTALRAPSPKAGVIAPLLPPSRVSLGSAYTSNTSAVSLRTTTGLSTVPVSQNISPAILSRGPSPLSTPPTLSPPVSSSSQELQTSTTESQFVMKVMKELIIRPTTEVDRYTTQASSPEPTSLATITAEQQSSAVSLRLVDSLTEIVEASVKALVEVVSHDLNELIIAIDDLMRAINRQTRLVVEQSKSTAQIVREQIEYRHNRAKGKARELKEMGTQLMSYASDKFLGRTEMAKKRAHGLKDKVTSSGVWSSYSKAHGQWSSRPQDGHQRADPMRTKLEV